MEGITRLKQFGRLLSYKLKQKIVVITIGVCSIPAILLFSLPLTVRLAYSVIVICLGMVPISSAVNLLVGSSVQSIQISLYNRKHKPQKVFNPRVKEMAERIGLKNYNKPINITDNPSVKTPFVNLGTEQITLPSHFKEEFNLADIEVDVTLGHELGHIKTKRTVMKELLLVSFGTTAISFLLGLITIPILCQIAEFAIMMYLLTRVLRRNELRADIEGAKAVTPEALISVFESFKARFKKDEGSDTHPSLQERIDRLMPLLDEGKQDKSKQWT